MHEQLIIKDVVVQVHKEVHEGFRVKLLIPSIGLFVNGIRVYPPNPKHPEEWTVLTPAFGNSKQRTVEFNPHLELWGIVREKCIEAVKEHTAGDPVPPNYQQDVVLKDIPDGPIDWSKVNIPLQ